MKLQQDGNYFLATGECTSEDLYFVIEQKTDYTRVSTKLYPEHAKMLRNEIDFWLKQISEESKDEHEDEDEE